MISCEVTRKGNTSTIRVSGDLTMETVGDFVATVRDHLQAARLTVSFDGIGSFDLCGLQVLYALYQSRVRSGGSLQFAGDDALQRFQAMARFAGLEDLQELSHG